MSETQAKKKRRQACLQQGDGPKAVHEAVLAEEAAWVATKSRFQAILRQYTNLYFGYS